jgi:tetratricopeptide (TPR) repeat protein
MFDAFPFLMVAIVPGHFHDLQGVAFYQQQKYDRAREEFSRALKSDPHDALALTYRGVVYSIDREYEAAVTDLNGAIAIKPSAYAYYERMLAYLGERQYADADRDLAHAIKLDVTEAHYYREKYYSARARYESDDDLTDASISDWTAAIRLNPKKDDYHHSRASEYMIKSQYDQAIADYGVVIQAKPADADAYAERAMAFDFKRDLRRARADYDTAIRLSPRDPYLYIGRSGIESAAGDHAGAVSDLEKAVKLKAFAYGYYRLGVEFTNQPRPDFGRAIGALSLANDLSNGTDSETLDTLASACAGVGLYKHGEILRMRRYRTLIRIHRTI